MTFATFEELSCQQINEAMKLNLCLMLSHAPAKDHLPPGSFEKKNLLSIIIVITFNSCSNNFLSIGMYKSQCKTGD